jgi:urocanate hydratase
MSKQFTVTSGSNLRCRGWRQEGLLRLLENVLAVGEDPGNLVVYAALGKAARDWPSHDKIVETLRTMADDETLIVQSGKPIGLIKTHDKAPIVIMANCNIVGQWAKAENFYELQNKNLICWGGLTAGDWQYIGSQGVIQGTYEIFMRIAERHFENSLKGRFILTAGLGGMGGAQPLAASMNGAVFLGVEVDPARAQRRLDTRFVDAIAKDLDEALALCAAALRKKEPRSIAVIGNAADAYPQLLKRGLRPDLVTDQTAAHDPLNGYIPQGLSLEEAAALRHAHPDEYVRRARDSMAVQVRAMLDFASAGSHVFDYGNNIRAQAKLAGVENAFDFPGFVPAYIRPMFCQGKGPFRWVALSGDPEDIRRTDRAMIELFPHDLALKRWLTLAQERVAFQGLPARICWLGYGERDKAGLVLNDLVRRGEVKAPIVIGRDHLDCGSVASPNRETEGMRDGSDAIADWPILNALVNAVNGASWVSFHHGGGVGIGYSLHAGQVIVADGTVEAGRRIARVLTSDPGMGILRHADAGYEDAVTVAHERGVKIPGITI